MPLGPKILLQLVKKNNLVENLSERELTNPEGAGFDLRVGEVLEMKKGRAFLGIIERQTPEVESVAVYNPGVDKQETYRLLPGKFMLITTIEEVRVPLNLASHLFARSTLFRSGAILLCTQIAPGYQGKLTMGLYNFREVPENDDSNDYALDIEMGARVAHIQFEGVLGIGSKYRGQWQGGRISATKKEKQV